ncbi:MAG: SusC/RagA family TonB-linked outer membrane protein [Gemmatimonadales bacterium]
MITAALRSFTRRSLLAVGLVAASAATLAAQGVVVGRVTDQANGSGLVGARVVVVGTSLTTMTNAEGRYRLTGMPTGAMQVRASQIGYASATKTVTVDAATQGTVDFVLVLTPYSLDDVVVTATGDMAKREVGNAVSTVEVSNLVQTTPIANMNDLLVAKAPGVQVLPGNITGGGARVRIRGNSSLSLSNNPIYVVDGVRIVSDVNSSSIGIGGTNPARVNDLNPEDIESIDVVRGPSASTLYGTDAANGVIIIKTKRGKAGRPQWNAYVEQGAIKDNNDYPFNYRAWTTGSTASNTTQCFLSGLIARTCSQDSVTAYNPWRDPDASPLASGHRQQYGLQVSGGLESVRYYLSGEYEDEIGVIRMPDAFQTRLLASRNIGKVPYSQQHPNALRKTNLRANVTAQLSDKADVAVSSGFVSSTQRLPQTDNNTTGLGSNLYGGPGFKNNIVSPVTGVTRNNLGYRLYTPDEFFSETVTQNVNRAITSATFNYRPVHWLAGRVVGGVDFISREDADLCRRDECTYFGISKLGFKANNRTTFFTYTADANATATYNIAEQLGTRTTAGFQFVKETFARNGAEAEDLTPGGTTVSSGATPDASEASTLSATLGFFVEQVVSWKDRVFLTGAVRSDQNSAFGQDFERVYYPKVSASYVISDEPFFPHGGLVNSLRLRGAYGASGRQPGSIDAIRFLVPTTASVDGVDTPGLVLSQLGNPDLKPERTSEIELGFDLSLAQSRVNIEFTAYRKRSRDALISRTIAPSAGGPATRLENIGQTENKGLEASINALVLTGRDLSWDVTLSGSYNEGKILSLGGNPPNRGTTTSDIEGYPIQGWWLRPVDYTDTNGDGLIALTEITVGDTAVYVGPPLPPAELTLYNSIELFNKRVRIQGLVDAKLGGYQLNGNERIRCQNRFNCSGDVNPKAPLAEQAAAVAVRQHPSATQVGYVQSTDFLRFRELSLTYNFPDRWAGFFGSNRISITGSARNLGFITNYKGIDPESGYFGTNIGVVSDFQTAPPPSYFTVRLNVGF